MPTAPPTRCPCGLPATTRGRCDEHQPKPWARRSAHTRQIDRGRWERVRQQQLRDEPRCRQCGAEEHLQVDHILNIARGGALYDRENLQTLCKPCHDKKSERERLAGLRARPRG